MISSKYFVAGMVLAILGLLPLAGAAPGQDLPNAKIVAMDPATDAILAKNDRLHIWISYKSKTPVRFQAEALRQGAKIEVGGYANPSYLHAQGEGEALAWLSFSTPTHIDEVKVSLLDAEWNEIGSLSAPIDISWQGVLAETPRKPAEWVKRLIKIERHNLDYVYDPVPDKEEAFSDLIFLLTVGSAPGYILLQLYMLRNYRGRWRELAAIPLITCVPLLLYALIVSGITFQQWVAFIFRCMPFALAYLTALWFIKWVKSPGSPVASR